MKTKRSVNKASRYLVVFTRGQFGLQVLSLPACVCVCVRVCVCVCLSVCFRVSVHHKFVLAITQQPFQLGSPNLDQRWKRPRLRSPSPCRAIDHDFQGQSELKSQNLPHFEWYPDVFGWEGFFSLYPYPYIQISVISYPNSNFRHQITNLFAKMYPKFRIIRECPRC